MYKNKLSVLLLVLSGAICTNVEAKLYKWVDDNGTTHYGETIPPEYANKDATKFSDKGRVEKHIEHLTPEEMRAKEAEDQKKNTAQQAIKESKRKDDALLNTYSNEKEIDQARDRSLRQVEARVSSFTTLLKSAQDSLANLLKEQDGLNKQNKKIPKELLDDIAESNARIVKQQKELTQNEQELANVKARFEAEKQRYRELKSGASGTPSK